MTPSGVTATGLSTIGFMNSWKISQPEYCPWEYTHRLTDLNGSALDITPVWGTTNDGPDMFASYYGGLSTNNYSEPSGSVDDIDDKPDPGAIPEPTTLILLGIGLAGVGLRRKFRK
jgi:hypothetical protein